MILLLADNDVLGPVRVVLGPVRVVQRIIYSEEWRAFAEPLHLRFIDFRTLGLERNASDAEVWQTCQSVDAVLITANRVGNRGGLEMVIRERAHERSWPVMTLADPRRVMTDADYAESVAVQLLDYLDRLDTLRGVGRLFLP